MRSVWFLLAACGCRGILGIEAPIDLPDDAVDAPALCATWHPTSIDPCALGAPAPMRTLAAGGYTYDTTEAGGTLFDATGHAVLESRLTVPQDDGSMLAVLSIDALVIDAGAMVQVIGAKPLMIVSWSTIAVGGALDASSHSGVTDEASHTVQTVQAGAGANASCTADLGSDGGRAANAGLGSGGGGGGARQGAGGAASAGGKTDVPGGAGGSPVPALVLRGGCRGGFSGAAGERISPPLQQSLQSPGGAGGGAIRIVARDAISITGSIRANGAGGAGAPTRSACGGGGGGSGGAIELEAPLVAIDGALVANGGGGGGGGNKDEAGHDGADGTSDLVAAPGGAVAGSGCGAAGGAGSVSAQLAGSTATEPDACGSGVDGGGGGGGGGGAGFIVVTSPQITTAPTATISPPLAMR